MKTFALLCRAASHACPWDTFLCPIPWQSVPVHPIQWGSHETSRMKYIISCACRTYILYSRGGDLRPNAARVNISYGPHQKQICQNSN